MVTVSPSSARKLLMEVSVNYDAVESFGITDLAAISVVDEQQIKFREIFIKSWQYFLRGT
ncbi:hypothetical protein L484_008082 [Morus notabilis]|uniref:Uncharacterized protein n=1 Tax=Morus notabilis TaxID=981085 RepID=W9RDK0_9ROSA|nr:hypothetical protein L484_008082 [Morus notabilis]